MPGVKTVFGSRSLAVFDPDTVSTSVSASPTIVITTGVVWELPAKIDDVLDNEGPDTNEVFDRGEGVGKEDVVVVDGVLFRVLKVVTAEVLDPVAVKAGEADKNVAVVLETVLESGELSEVSLGLVEWPREAVTVEMTTVEVPEIVVMMLITIATSVLCSEGSRVDVDDPELSMVEGT